MTKTLCKHNRHVAAVSPLCRRSPRSFEDALDVLDGNPASVLRGVVVILVSHFFTGSCHIFASLEAHLAMSKLPGERPEKSISKGRDPVKFTLRVVDVNTHKLGSRLLYIHQGRLLVHHCRLRMGNVQEMVYGGHSNVDTLTFSGLPGRLREHQQSSFESRSSPSSSLSIALCT